jgi:hypothetical protein
LYRTIKHAYGEGEKNNLKRQSFLSPNLYSRVYERFKGKPLPVDMLGKMFIREFNVDEKVAAKIAGYFIEGAELCGLLVNGILTDSDNNKLTLIEKPIKIEDKKEEKNDTDFLNDISMPPVLSGDAFTVHIIGAGINSKLILSEEEDFIILEAMISK